MATLCFGLKRKKGEDGITAGLKMIKVTGKDIF